MDNLINYAIFMLCLLSDIKRKNNGDSANTTKYTSFYLIIFIQGDILSLFTIRFDKMSLLFSLLLSLLVVRDILESLISRLI